MFWYFNPKFIYNFPNFRQPHFPVPDFSEKTMSFFRTDCYKIRGIPTIIPINHSGGGDAVFVMEFLHFEIEIELFQGAGLFSNQNHPRP